MIHERIKLFDDMEATLTTYTHDDMKLSKANPNISMWVDMAANWHKSL